MPPHVVALAARRLAAPPPPPRSCWVRWLQAAAPLPRLAGRRPASTASPGGGGCGGCPAAAPVCCWSCGACANQWNLVCGSCSLLQPLDRTANFFQLLGVPQTFDVDVAALERAFKSRQKSVHPDLFGSRSPPEQQVSAQLSSNLNIGYRLLRNPVSRAQYLLQLAGLDAIGEGAGSVRVPPALLGEVLEGRELLEDAAGAPPGGARAAAAARVRALADDTDARVRLLLRDASAHFAAGDLPAAATATVALQYLTKLRAEAGEWLMSDTSHPQPGGCGACEAGQQCQPHAQQQQQQSPQPG